MVRLRLGIVLASSVLAGFATCGAATASSMPAQPRVLLDTTYTPPTGNVIRVHSGDDLQAALDRAVPGDQVVLDAGATFTGNFVPPKKAGSGLIVLRTSDIGALREGARAGPGDASHMARIISPSFDGAVDTAPGAHQWRLIGIELTVSRGVSENTAVVSLGSGAETTRSQLPREIVIDRCWIHGNSIQNDRRGVALNGDSEAVI